MSHLFLGKIVSFATVRDFMWLNWWIYILNGWLLSSTWSFSCYIPYAFVKDWGCIDHDMMPSINQSLFFTIVKQENEQAMNVSFSNYATYENRARLRWLAQPGMLAVGWVWFPTSVSHQDLFPILIYNLSHVEPQRNYDVSVAYGAMDGPGDL